MKYVCQKCGMEFENKGDCYRHEEICGLPESDICTIHLFEIRHDPIRFFDTITKVPYSSLEYQEYVFNVPWENYNGDFLIRVEEKNKTNGLRKLFEFASKKMQERIGNLQEQLQKIKELSLEKLDEEK